MDTVYDDMVDSGVNRSKFLVGGLLILAAVVYLIVTSLNSNQQYFLTINELNGEGDNYINVPARITGAVIGDTINYDPDTLTLTFTVVHIPADNDILDEEGGLAAALKAAVSDPSRERIDVVYYGVMPDLLQNEAQAIMTGKLGEDGIFYVDELLLKCPTRYEEAVPGQSDS